MKHFLVSIAFLFLYRPAEAAGITRWRGEVDLKKSGGSAWARLEGTETVPLATGDELRIARASTAEVFYGGRVQQFKAVFVNVTIYSLTPIAV